MIIQKEQILDIVKNIKIYKNIIIFSSTPVGYKYLISISIFVDGNMSTFESHAIADKLEKEINQLILSILLLFTLIHLTKSILFRCSLLQLCIRNKELSACQTPSIP